MKKKKKLLYRYDLTQGHKYVASVAERLESHF